MRTDHHHARSTRHIQPPVFGAEAADPADAGDDSYHFTDAGRLSEGCTDAIVEALLGLKIGDRESCRLFVRAMEYELTDYRHALTAEPHHVAPESAPPQTGQASQRPELAAITRAAHDLAGLLDTLPDDLKQDLLQNLEAQDEMHRGYDRRYLDQLRIEASRLAAACGGARAQSEPAATTAAPRTTGPSPASLHFVFSLVHMFEECFETKPTAEPDGAFARTLAVLGEGIGIAIPNDPETLAVALGRG